MDFAVEERDGVGIVRIKDDITVDNIQAFRDFIASEVNSKFKLVILDMTKVDYFCSSAYGVMLRCLEATRGQSGDMVLANASESVRRLFEVTRLTSVVRLEDTEESALKYLQKSTRSS